MKHLMKGDLALSLKLSPMNMCILSVLTYGSPIWSLTEAQKSKLEVCQRAIQRSVLDVKLLDRIRNITQFSQTQSIDVPRKAAKFKWAGAGQVCRMPNKLWTQIATQWRSHKSRRRCGRPRWRWWFRRLFENLARGGPEPQSVEEEGGEAFAKKLDIMG